MNAIIGIFERSGSAPLEASIAALLAYPTDYGTDGSHQWISGSIGLGHQLMTVFTERRSDCLPLHDAMTGLAITADVRLDNRTELCKALNIPDCEKQNLSDSQLILCAWQKWGRGCPRHLIGDYAFAIWDDRQQTLFCARDHIGVRPFYYSLTPERFVFASDIKGVLAVPGISDQLDEDYVIASLNNKFLFHPDRTFLTAVKKLPPGHSLTISRDTDRLERYWHPQEVKEIRFANDLDYAEAAREIYTQAVSDRLNSNLPIGVHLSGGLDSSSVTVLATRELHRRGQSPPTVFSWQPPPEADSHYPPEHDHIQAVCEQEGLTPLYCPTNAEDILEVFKKDPTREPITNTLLIEATIQRKAKEQGIRLILSGWGGDEGLSYGWPGYHQYLFLRGRWWKYIQECKHQPHPYKYMVLQAILLLFRDPDKALRKIEARSFKDPNRNLSFLHPDLKKRIKLKTKPCRYTSIRSTLFWVWNCGYLTDRMESWAAHGAQNQITYAYPLLDRRLLEYVASLPPEQIVRGKWRRWPMRTAMEGILPDQIRWHPSKWEPIRVEKMMPELNKAIELASQQLFTASELPARSSYLDMPRLMEKLQPEVLATKPKLAYVTHSLQFLDF